MLEEAVFFFIIFVTVPLFAWYRIERSLTSVQDRLEDLHDKLNRLQERLEAETIPEEPRPVTETRNETIADEQSEPLSEPIPTAVIDIETEPAAIDEEPGETVPVEEPAEQVEESVAAEEPSVPVETLEAEPAMASEQEATERRGFDYEKFIGENLFGKIGILVFIIGIGFFVKYAIDRNWIGEVARTALGFVVGGCMVALGERLRERYRAFSSLLIGGGFGVFYITVAIAFHYYHLFSDTIAFLTLVGLTVAMGGMAIFHDRRELAVTALAGGFIAPFITSVDENDALLLLSYLAILNIGMFILSVYKEWRELPVVAFGFTSLAICFGLVTGSFVENDRIGVVMWLFSTLFFFIFMLSPIWLLRDGKAEKLTYWLIVTLVANGFVYLPLGVYFLEEQVSFETSGLLSFFISAVHIGCYLVLRRKDWATDTLQFVLPALGIIFFSMAIPLQFDGQAMLVLWSAEAVMLLLLYVKLCDRVYALGCMLLSAATLFYYLYTVEDSYVYDELILLPVFFNGTFFTALFPGLCAVAVAVVMERYRSLFEDTDSLLPYHPLHLGYLLLGITTVYFAFYMEYEFHTPLDSSLSDVLLGLTLGVFAFVEMCLGMKLHRKDLRMVSLGTFGLVLFKLVIYDVWMMPAWGKIVVFIVLGLLLLTLSFLYQKLRDVLF